MFLSKKIKVFICILFLSYMPCALAILPPYYQSVREIERILGSSEVAKKLSAYPIQSIVRNEGTETSYSVTVKDCTLKVKIIYKPAENGFVGPAEFDIVPEPEPVCRSKS